MSIPQPILAVLQKSGIRLKLAATISLGVCSIFLVVTVLTFRDHKETLQQSQIEHGGMVSSLLAHDVAGPTQFRDSDRIAEILKPVIERDPQILAIDIVHTSGEALIQHDKSGSRLPEVSQDIQATLADAKTNTSEIILFQNGYLVISQPIVARKANQSVGALIMVWDSASYEAMILAKTKRTLAKGGGVALLGLISIVALIGRLVTGPIQNLSTSMMRIAEHQFDTEIAYSERSDEIGHMARDLTKFRNSLAEESRLNQKRETKIAQRQAVLQRLAEGLSELADGRVERPINVAEFDKMEEDHIVICTNFNAVLDKLRNILSTITTSAESVRTSSAEIADVTVDQSKRSENQAVTLEESAAAIESLSASVEQTAERAAEANDRIVMNRKQAQAGGEVVSQTVEAMKSIEASSNQITAIIGVIDDIAFQTNLLALNAGVEAARAGEAGRGFAVVASEVRALAQRASESANEIKELILRSGEQVTNGSALASKAGQALNEIITGVNQASDLVSLIATGSREQANNLAEIKDSVTELDRVTQQNAAVIQESSAASRNLSEEATRLADVMKTFRFEGVDVGDSIQAWDVDEQADRAQARKETESFPIMFASRAGSTNNPLNQSDEWHDF